jgi:hypothetical protein
VEDDAELTEQTGTTADPMTYQGRVITAEVITEMRAVAPENAHQLDARWKAMTLAPNAPWIRDPAFLACVNALWTGLTSAPGPQGPDTG